MPKILIAPFSKSLYLVPQTVASTPFSTPIPAISHLGVFGFNSEKSENNLNFSENSFVACVSYIKVTILKISQC